MFQFPGFALIPLWIQRISTFIYNPLPQHIDCSMCRDNGSQKVGCPIRKSRDQSLFAAPPSLSQRTTSFIASQRQGIRRIPFRHLIVLEIRKRTVQGERCFESPKQGASDVSRAANKRPASADAPQSLFQFEKTSFASNTSGIFAVRLRSRLVCSRLQVRRWTWNFFQAGRRSQDETGYASSSRCQIFAKETAQPNSRPGYRIPPEPLHAASSSKIA